MLRLKLILFIAITFLFSTLVYSSEENASFACAEKYEIKSFPPAYEKQYAPSDYKPVFEFITSCISAKKQLKDDAAKEIPDNLAKIKSLLEKNLNTLNVLAEHEPKKYTLTLKESERQINPLITLIEQVTPTKSAPANDTNNADTAADKGYCKEKPLTRDDFPAPFEADNGRKEVSDYSGVEKYISSCGKQLAEADKLNKPSLRQKVVNHLKDLKQRINQNQDYVTGTTYNDDNFKMAFASQNKTRILIDKINDLLNIEKPNYLIPSFNDLAFSYQFYSGIEYNKVGDLFDESNLRLGFQGYLRLGKSIDRMRNQYAGQCQADEKCGNWWNNFPHIIGNVLLTGAGETAAVDTDSTMQGDTNNATQSNDNDGASFDAIEYEFALFYPLYLGVRGQSQNQTYQELAFGLIALTGGRKTDELDSFEDRHYMGFRFANNEETYFDILYGKSQPLKGRRVELRGQLPVSELGTGKLFLGAVANFEVDKRKRDDDNNLVSEEDSFKLYLSWQTTFDSLWKGLNGD